ncbi:MAG TPA: hypothetical protein VE309_11550 [Caulobacteraceae bacterium]|nr:hypothetical protein [Caulobacteraceae bacterium]
MSDVSASEAVVEAPEPGAAEGAVPNAPAAAAARAPLSAEEYERRLQAQGRDLREQRRQIRALNERLNQAGAQPHTPAERAAKPDMETNPIGYMRWADQRLEFYERREAEAARQQEEQSRQQAAVAQIARRMEDFEKDFADDHPDYFKAAAHFRTARTAELAEEGVSAADMAQALRQDFVNVIARATRAGKDPAEVVYKLARNRGFGADSDDKKLQTISRAANAGRTLSGAGGAAGEAELTVEYVNGLSGKAFTEARARLRAQTLAAEKKAARG